MNRYLVILMLSLWFTGSAAAANWADGMFDSLWRDFGSVPRGPVISHPFRLVNNTGQTVRIRGVRVSCGCVSIQTLKTTLAPGEETAIIAKMDTRRFSDTRTVTIFVNFDRPAWAETRLWVRASSRADVNIAPPAMSFGRIKRATTPERTVTISLYGSDRYRILNVWTDSNYVKPLCRMIRHTTHEVTYQLTAKLRGDTPPGRWYTDIWIRTNNPAMTRVRIPLTVDVVSNLSVSPSMVLLGKVNIGGEEVRKIIVRGVRPFRIVGIQGADEQIRVHSNSAQQGKVHILTVVLRPLAAGQIDRTLHIQTDLPQDNSIDFTARAYAVP